MGFATKQSSRSAYNNMKACRLAIAIALVMVCSSVAWGERLSVFTPFANIRSGPAKSFDILWKVEKYHPLLVFEKSGNWFHFRDFEGDQGWIHRSLLGKTPTVITKSEKCNIREGPGTSFNILFTVGKGIPFKTIKRKGNCIRIRHADGDKGWIHKSLVW